MLRNLTIAAVCDYQISLVIVMHFLYSEELEENRKSQEIESQ